MRAVEQIELIAGRLALDFVNTANWVDELPVDDRLGDSQSIERWADRVGITPCEECLDAPQVELVVEARRLVRDLFVAEQADQPAEPIERLIKSTIDQPGPFGPKRFLLAVLFSALEVNTQPRRSRVRECPGERCGWLFLDDSPAGRRRWCSMATCGNRAKATQHYHRKMSRPAQ